MSLFLIFNLYILCCICKYVNIVSQEKMYAKYEACMMIMINVHEGVES